MVLRQFRGKLLPIILLKIRMLCHPERSEGSRAGTENYTARDFARLLFPSASEHVSSLMLRTFRLPPVGAKAMTRYYKIFAAPKLTKNQTYSS